MRPTMIVAVILIGLGIVVLAYSGITYKTRGEPVDIGPLHIETTKSHFIPPVAGERSRWSAASCCLSWTPERPDERGPKKDMP